MFLAIALGMGLLQPAAPEADLLVGSKRMGEPELRRLIRPYGVVQGSHEGFLQVQTSRRNELSSHLRKSKVEFIFDASASQVDRQSYPSVKQHIDYIKARAKLLGHGPGVKNSAGFYEALAYYLEPRVGLDGTIDEDGIRRAVAQRDRLPMAWIGKNPRAPSGAFNYVGPKALDIPKILYFGTPSLSGRVNDVAYAPSNANVIYVASAGGGVWKSTNQGTNWSFKSSNWDFLHTTSVAVHPTNENLVLVGTGDYYGMFGEQTMGIMRSTNGGSTWTHVGTPEMQFSVVTRIVFNPDNPDIVIALTEGSSGDIWRSTDAGITWTPTNAPAGNWDDIDYGVRSGSTREFFAVGGDYDAGGRIYKSTNAGSTWQLVHDASTTDQGMLDVACSKLDFGKLWVLHPGGNTMFRSSNSGASWTDLNLSTEPTFPNAKDVDNPLYNWGQDLYDLHVETAVYEGTEYLYCGLITLAVSTNGGNTWTDVGRSYQTNSRLHNDQHCFTPHPLNGSLGLIGCDGGLFRIQYVPGVYSQIISLNDELYTTQFYHMSVHPTNSNHIMGGTQDNAVPASRGSLSSWKNLKDGDGSWSAFQPNDPAIHYSSAQRGSVYRYSSSTDYEPDDITLAWQSVNFIAPLVIANSSRVLLGANAAVQRYSGIGTGWTPGTPSNFGSDVRTLAVGISNRNRVYAGLDNGDIYRSDDNADTFTKIDASPLPNTYIGAIACKASSSTDVLVGLQSSSGGLYLCRDTTAASPVWTSVSGSGSTALPASPVNAVIWDPHDPTVWYVGTDVGAFMTTDSGATWRNMNGLGIGNVHVNAFAIPEGNDYLYVATFGRGIWRIPLIENSLSTFVPSITQVYGGLSFAATVTIAQPAPPGTRVTLSDNSSYLSMPTSVEVTQGSTAAIFMIDTSQVFSSERTATLTASAFGNSITTTVTIKPYPTVASFTLAKTYLYGGVGTTGTATLSAPAPFTDSFTFTDNSAFVSVVSPVTVAQGATSRTTNITTVNPATVQAATITASYKGTSRTATLSVYPMPVIQSLTMTPNPVLAGYYTDVRVTLANPAPITTDLRFTENSAYIPISSTRILQAGQTSLTFQAYASQPPSDQVIPVSVAVVGNENNPTNANLNLYRTALTSATCLPNTIKGGKLGVLTVHINRPLVTTRVISLTSSNPAVASVPATVTLVVGDTLTRCTVRTFPVASSQTPTLTATYLGTTAATTVTVTP